MPLPSQIVTVPVVATFEQGDGTPYAGTATATASVPGVLVPGSQAVLTPPVVSRILDSNGSVSLPLWSTDNSNASPTGWTWTVSVALDGVADPLVWDVAVPGTAGTVNLASVSMRSTGPVTGATAYVTQAGLNSAIAAYIANNGGTTGGITMTQVDTEIDSKIATNNTALINGAPSNGDTFGELATRLTTAESNIVSLQGSVATSKPALNPTAVLTSAVTLGASDYALCNPDGGSFTVTAPPSPVDKTIVAVKHVGSTTSNPVTVSGGTFRNYNGTTPSLTLSIPGQWKELQYSSTNAEWEVRDGLSYNQISAMFAPAQNSPNYASAGAAFKTLLMESGDAVVSGMDLRPNGERVPGAFTIGAFQVSLDIPANGAQTWRLVAFHSDNTSTTVATVTLNSLTRAAVTTGLSYAVAATDRLLVQCSSAAGTYLGQGPTATVALGTGSTLTVPTAPATPTGLTAGTGTTSIPLSWSPSTGATNYLIVVDSVPQVVTSNTSYSYPVTAGSAHSFQVAAMCPDAASALSSSVSAGAYTSYPFFNQTDGAPVGWSTVLGGTANGQAVTVTSNIAHLISGNSGGSSNSTDMVGMQVNADGATHTLWDVKGQFCLDNSTSFFDLVLGANQLASGFTMTNGVQFEFTPTQGRIGIKAASYNSGAFTTPTYSTTPGAASGYSNYPSTLGLNANGVNFYGFRCIVSDPGDGTLTASFYVGSTSQLSAGTLPLFLQASLPSAFKSAFAAGYCYIRQLGATGTTAATEGSRFQQLTITPTSAAGA